jgi:uracil-DNA glycosylase
LNVTDDTFYNDPRIAIMPMGFCYPGTGNSGDLPPRPECATEWHELLLKEMPNLELFLLIGQYAQKYYLKGSAKKNLTETVRNFGEYAPKFLPTPHPSPRNRFWMKKNPWFEMDIVPYLQGKMAEFLKP